jgi:hypothetical protein
MDGNPYRSRGGGYSAGASPRRRRGETVQAAGPFIIVYIITRKKMDEKIGAQKKAPSKCKKVRGQFYAKGKKARAKSFSKNPAVDSLFPVCYHSDDSDVTFHERGTDEAL